jgi:hypothetical protein
MRLGLLQNCKSGVLGKMEEFAGFWIFGPQLVGLERFCSDLQRFATTASAQLSRNKTTCRTQPEHSFSKPLIS